MPDNRFRSSRHLHLKFSPWPGLSTGLKKVIRLFRILARFLFRSRGHPCVSIRAARRKKTPDMMLQAVERPLGPKSPSCRALAYRLFSYLPTVCKLLNHHTTFGRAVKGHFRASAAARASSHLLTCMHKPLPTPFSKSTKSCERSTSVRSAAHFSLTHVFGRLTPLCRNGDFCSNLNFVRLSGNCLNFL